MNHQLSERENNLSIKYKNLIDLLKNTFDVNADEIYSIIGKAIDSSKDTIKNYIEGEHIFSWFESKAIVKELVSCFPSDAVDEIDIFKTLLNKIFNIYTDDPDFGATPQKVEEFMSSIFEKSDADNKDEVNSTDTKDDNSSDFNYSNLPAKSRGKVLRKKLEDKIKNNLKDKKIIFLSGFKGTGKAFIAQSIAYDYLNDASEDYKIAVYNDCNSKSFSFSNLITNILLAFQTPNTCNLSLDQKLDLIKRFMKNRKIIIIIIGFDNITNETEQKEILDFLSQSIFDDSIRIITCGRKLSSYNKISSKDKLRFSEVHSTNLTTAEWKELSDAISKSNSYITEIKNDYSDLDDKIYEIGQGNCSLMILILFSINDILIKSRGYNNLVNYCKDNLDSLKETDLYQFITGLPENAIKILITLSLFVSPLSQDNLMEISGVTNKENFFSALNICLERFYIKQFYDTNCFTLLDIIHPTLKKEFNANPQKYEDIIDRWINFYINLTKNIGLCFNDVNRLSKLELPNNANESGNIIEVLSYCEKAERWKDFYTISEGSKYFFYTRGISGEGKKSVHYRRAMAARKLKNDNAEFDSILYYCNVACKSKSWDLIEECFERLDVLKETSSIHTIYVKKYDYVKALYYFRNQDKRDYMKAIDFFNKFEKSTKTSLDRRIYSDKIVLHDYIASLRWHCECIYDLLSNDPKNPNFDDLISKVNPLLEEAIALSEEINFARAIVHSHLLLIKFMIMLKKSNQEILEVYHKLDKYQEVINKDASYSIEYHKITEILKSL